MTLHMRFDVPFVSQYEDLADPDWQWRGCGIVALKMVLDFWHRQDARNVTFELNNLHRKGTEAGAYREGIGWSHGGLVSLARELSYESYNRDWADKGPTPKSAEQAWHALALELERGPVLVSVYSGLEPARGGGHIVVVTGFENDLVYFNDPEQKDEQEGRRILARISFIRAFKRRYVIIRPQTPLVM